MTTKLEQKTSSQEKSKKVWRLPTIPQWIKQTIVLMWPSLVTPW
jgi:hypothetical protein